jgi:MFS family permease
VNTPSVHRPLEPPERRSVITLLASSFTSLAAILALTTALGKQVYDLTGSELALGLLGLAEFAPNALLVLVTGSLADRFDRRRITSVSMLAQAATIGGLSAYTAFDGSSVEVVFAFVLVFGIARAFGWPAIRALPPDVVPRERVPWLTVRSSAATQAAVIVGPVIGGFMYVVDPSVPYLAAAAMSAAAGLTILRVRVRASEPAPTDDDAPEQIVAEAALEVSEETADLGPTMTTRARLREASAGFVFIRQQPVLLGAITLDLFAVLFGGAVALLPAIAEERLGVGAVGLGWLRSAIGIGAGAMILFLTWKPLRRHVGVTLFVAVAAFGAGTVVLGLTNSYAVAFGSIVVLSAADAISMFIRGTLTPLVTPARMRGRVLAFEMVFIGASNELGAFESGVAGQILGPAAAIVLGGVATLVIAVAWAAMFPALRTIDRFPGLEEPLSDRATTSA